jgi:SAM-dependent methyltransferase
MSAPIDDPSDNRILRDALRLATEEHYEDPELYDHEYRRRRADVNHYRALAAERRAASDGGVEILELGCGSGRLLVPLLRDGYRVVGVDLSRPMLERCRSRIERLSPWVRGRARLEHSDFRALRLGRRFPLVVCPFNAMMHLYSRRDIERFLDGVRAHLAPGGCFAFDVINPDLRWLTRDPEKRWARTRYRDPRTGRTYFYSTNTSYDPVTQIAWIRLFYDEEQDEEQDEEHDAQQGRSHPRRGPGGEAPSEHRRSRVVHLAQRQFFPQELLEILHYNGFSVEKRDGGFGGEPLDERAESQVCRCSIRRGFRR